MSQSKIYVGNLPYSTTDHDLQEHFSQFGAIQDVKVITDRETGRSKGFGFITFETEEGANAAIAAESHDLQGRQLRVNLAHDGGRRTGG